MRKVSSFTSQFVSQFGGFRSNTDRLSGFGGYRQNDSLLMYAVVVIAVDSYNPAITKLPTK